MTEIKKAPSIEVARNDEGFKRNIPAVQAMLKSQRHDVSDADIIQATYALFKEQYKIQQQTVELSPLEKMIPKVVGNDWDIDARLHAKGKGVGEAKIVANPSDDLPRIENTVDLEAKQIRLVGDSYGFSLVGSMGTYGVKLTSKADLCRAAVERKLTDISINGDKVYGLDGVLTTEHAIKKAVALDKTTLLAQINSLIRGFAVNAQYVYSVNKIALPSYIYELLADTYKANNETVSLLTTLTEQNKGIEFIPDASLGDEKKGVIMLGHISPSTIRHDVVAGFRQMAPQARNLEAVVNCVARTAGVEVIDKRALNLITYTLK